jgi:hypothetical protein
MFSKVPVLIYVERKLVTGYFFDGIFGTGVGQIEVPMRHSVEASTGHHYVGEHFKTVAIIFYFKRV